MRNTAVAQMIRPVGIALMLAALTTSLIVRVPPTLANRLSNSDGASSISTPWPVDDLASTGAGLTTQPQSEASLRAQVNKAYGKLPLSFELNQGQTHSEVKFLSRGPGYQLFLTQTEAVLAFKKPCSYCDEPAAKKSDKTSRTSEQERAVLRVRLVDANPAPQVAGLDELPGKSNYIKGNDRSGWQRNVPNYAKVRYSQVYAGVDLVYYGNQRQLEYDFHVAPFADPKPIEIAYEGADNLALDQEGNLLLQVKGVRLTQQAPVVYQEAEGVRQAIASRYVLKDQRRVGFEIGAYDSSRPLIIDPLLVYSTYLGGSIPGPEQIGDFAAGIATDASGNAYIVGTTDSEDFPMVAVADPYSEDHRNDTCSVGDIDFLKCGDVFVTKLNADGSNMVYSTFIGSDHDDQAFGIAVDSSNRAYITGGTDPFSVFGTIKHWPLTNNAFQRDAQFDARDAADAFVTVLNSTGTDLVYSTYYGGNNDAFATKIAETRGDTIGVFHTVGTPQFLLRNTNSGGSADQTVTFGENGDLPVAGDWDGNGIDDLGVFRPSAGQLLLRQFGVIRVCNPFCITTFGFTTITVPFGQAGDLPIVGDWDGVGDDTVGVYRPSNTTFFLSNSNQNPQNNIISVFGEAEDLPVAGDWNADGVDTIGVFRPSVTTFFLSNVNENPQNNIISVFGQAADLPMAGDWDGDGDDNIGVFRPSAARFNLSNDNSAISFNFIFGTAGDQPVAGDWDGNP